MDSSNVRTTTQDVKLPGSPVKQTNAMPHVGFVMFGGFFLVFASIFVYHFWQWWGIAGLGIYCLKTMAKMCWDDI